MTVPFFTKLILDKNDLKSKYSMDRLGDSKCKDLVTKFYKEKSVITFIILFISMLNESGDDGFEIDPDDPARKAAIEWVTNPVIMASPTVVTMGPRVKITKTTLPQNPQFPFHFRMMQKGEGVFKTNVKAIRAYLEAKEKEEQEREEEVDDDEEDIEQLVAEIALDGEDQLELIVEDQELISLVIKQSGEDHEGQTEQGNTLCNCICDFGLTIPSKLIPHQSTHTSSQNKSKAGDISTPSSWSYQ